MTEKELAQALVDLASGDGTPRMTTQLMQRVADSGDHFHAIVAALGFLRERSQLPPAHLLHALHTYDQTLTEPERLLLDIPPAPVP